MLLSGVMVPWSRPSGSTGNWYIHAMLWLRMDDIVTTHDALAADLEDDGDSDGEAQCCF